MTLGCARSRTAGYLPHSAGQRRHHVEVRNGTEVVLMPASPRTACLAHSMLLLLLSSLHARCASLQFLNSYGLPPSTPVAARLLRRSTDFLRAGSCQRVCRRCGMCRRRRGRVCARPAGERRWRTGGCLVVCPWISDVWAADMRAPHGERRKARGG